MFNAADPSRPALRPRALMAAAVAGTIIGYAGWSAQPEILSEVLVQFHLNNTQAALSISAETLALAITSILLTGLIQIRFPRLLMLIGAVIALAGHLLSWNAGSFLHFVECRAMAGMGEGLTLGLANVIIASLPDPDRAYANVNTGQILGGAVIVALVPLATVHIGHLPMLIVLSGITVLMLPLLLLSPPRTVQASASTAANHQPAPVFSLLSLWTSMLLFGTGSSALWAFFVEFGKRTTLTRGQIDGTISAAVLAGLAGTVLTSLISTRFGRRGPVLIALAFTSLTNFAITHSTIGVIYQVSVCVMIACLYVLVPFYQGYAATLDVSGRAAAIVGALFALTGATGPALGGWIASSWNLPAIGIAAVGLNVLAASLVFPVERACKRRRATTVR